MKTRSIYSYSELEQSLRSIENIFLLIYKKDAEQSICALQRLESVNNDQEKEILTVDVTSVPDIHSKFGITSAPSLLEFIDGELKNVYKGCQTEAFYTSAITGNGFATFGEIEGKKAKRVIVYTTPTCSWCTTLKTYLNENNIRYTEVNIAADSAKAEEMVRRSGQQGVPQTDIEGNMIVGFDKNRINELLELR